MRRSPLVVEFVCAAALALAAFILAPGPAGLAVVILIVFVLLGLSFVPSLLRARRRRRGRPDRPAKPVRRPPRTGAAP